jgi:hypothetical protein
VWPGTATREVADVVNTEEGYGYETKVPARGLADAVETIRDVAGPDYRDGIGMGTAADSMFRLADRDGTAIAAFDAPVNAIDANDPGYGGNGPELANVGGPVGRLETVKWLSGDYLADIATAIKGSKAETVRIRWDDEFLVRFDYGRDDDQAHYHGYMLLAPREHPSRTSVPIEVDQDPDDYYAPPW